MGTADRVPEQLLEWMESIRVGRGETIFDQDEPGDSVYLVVSGRVRIARRTETGVERVLAILGPGEMFGELALLDGKARSALAQALTSSTLRRLTQERLGELLAEDPHITEWMLRQVARRLRKANDIVASLVFSDVPGRVAQALLELSEAYGTSAPEGCRVAHDLTQHELAQMVGAARESVNKALAGFASRGWVTLGARSVIIHDHDALRARAG